jgi:hypothetical protein
MSKMFQRKPVSIVCVSNDPQVLNDCLVKSIKAHLSAAPQTELIVVENSQQQFPSAGAALNHGASLSHHEVCVFVHQDVYLHSLMRLEEAAAALWNDPEIGLVGAIGMTASRKFCGRVRDRVVLLGRATNEFAEVHSVDEVFFMVRRDQILHAPLTEDADLSWHAYAVEYCARMRKLGKRVMVGRIPLTHNSLMTNMDRLTEAHAHVGALYPEQLPINTTCGVIDGVTAKRTKLFASHRWRYQWLRGSYHAYLARRAVGRLPVVLSHIHFDIDNVLEDCGEPNLAVVALGSERDQDIDLAECIELHRLGRTLTFQVSDAQAVMNLLSGGTHGNSLLLTNFDKAFLTKVRGFNKEGDALLGFSWFTGFWLLIGPAAKASPEAWRLPSTKPLGLRGVR